jgi:hypothetical protein
MPVSMHELAQLPRRGEFPQKPWGKHPSRRKLAVPPQSPWVFLKLCGCFGGQLGLGGSLVLRTMLAG